MKHAEASPSSHASHGEFAHLDQVVLHDIADNAKLVKVTAAAVGAEGLLEADLHVGNEVAVPRGRQELVRKSAHIHQQTQHGMLYHDITSRD